MREHDIIRRYFTFTAAAGTGVTLGIGDDAAAVTPPAGDLVISTDTLNAGVHFFPDTDPAMLAQKAAAVSLSDIAAMGGKALWLTVALTAPPATGSDWFSAFAGGLAASSRAYHYSIIGGDLTAAALLTVTTTAAGVCAAPPCTRAAAVAGDELWVSGTIGGAAHALGVLSAQLPPAKDMRAAFACLHTPAPRLVLGQALAGSVHAMLDLSDGLLAGGETLAAASAVRLRLDAGALAAVAAPSLRALTPPQAQQCLFYGGDDYELLFTAPPAAAARIQALATRAVPLTRIGVVADSGSGIEIHRGGKPLTLPADTAGAAGAVGGYSHVFSP